MFNRKGAKAQRNAKKSQQIITAKKGSGNQIPNH